MRPEGAGTSGVMVFAEALGEHEERESLPLRPHAPAGSIFQYIIRSQGWDREQFVLSNVLWCRPGPKNYLKGAPYEYEAIEHCQQYNDHLIATRRPKVLLALGDIAMRTLTGHVGKKQGISMLRGFVLHSQRYNLPVVATWHPSYLIGRSDEQVEKGTGGGGGKKHTGTIARDVALALRIARDGAPPPDQTDYIVNPTAEDAQEYLSQVLAHPEWTIAFDIENPKTQKEDEDELSYELAPIIQIQFSHKPKWGMALPWVEPFISIAKAILAAPNVKVGHNVLQYDIPILLSHDAPVNGFVHDTQWLWHSIQPDLPRGLQFMTSFYAPTMKPWKHTSANLAEYGCADVDAPHRCLPHLLKDLDVRNVRGSYEQKLALVPIVNDVKQRGLPVDAQAQAAYAIDVESQMQALVTECQTLIPMSLRGIHPKQGYSVLSAKLKQLVASYNEADPPLVELATTSGHLMRLDDEKWCLRKLFNPNSTDQLIRYIQYRRATDIAERMSRGYDKAKAERTTLWKVPTKRSGKASTGVLELTPLVKKTQDRVLQIAQKYRELDKGLDFASGKWVPGADGRVHPTFSFGTSTGQMTSSGPNAQQLSKHNEQGEVIRQFVRAPENFVFVEFDFTGFHALMVGLLSKDPTYMRMARYGVHDFVVAHMMRLPEADGLASLSDAELESALKEIKRKYKPERNKAKRCIAEGQLVLTDHGLKPIESVELADRVWDGVEWVAHEGIIFQGEQDVITYDGLTATPDHEVYTRQGRTISFGYAASQKIELATAGIVGQGVRPFGDYLHSHEVEEGISLRQGPVCADGNRALDLVRSPSQGSAEVFLPQWEIARSSQGSVGQAIRLHSTPLSKSEGSRLQMVWGPRDRMSHDARRIRELRDDDITPRELQRRRDRSEGQQRPLRSWEPASCLSSRADEQSQQHSLDQVPRQKNSLSGFLQSIRKQLDRQISVRRTDRRADYKASTGSRAAAPQKLAQHPSPTRKVRVYDILNAGPRHRYTVSGRLVHNCVHGVNFGEGAYKLHQVHSDLFASRAEAQEIIKLIFKLFPKLAQWQDAVRWQAHNDPNRRLRSPFGYHRYFYDVWRYGGRQAGESSEECIAYLPANLAHGHYRERLIELWNLGLIQRYGACNLIHDAVLFLCPTELQDECIAQVQPVLEAPSKVIIDPQFAPEGLYVGTDASVGLNWGEYHAERNPDGMREPISIGAFA